MVLAAEYTAATLVGWLAVALVVGLIIGWLLRPWLVGDRLREDYEKELRDEQRRRTDAEGQVEAARKELSERNEELDVMRGDSARLKADLATARNRAADLEAQVASLAVEKDAEISRLSTEASKVSSLEVAVGERDARIAALEAAVAERDVESARAKAVAEAADAARARLQGNEAKLASARQRAEEAESALAALETQQASYEAHLAESAAVIAELETRMSQMTPAAVPEATASDATGPVSVAPHLEPVQPEHPDTAESISEGAPETVRADVAPASIRDDDLKEIRGIGPAIERKLKAMGIATFEQIANLTPQQKSDIGEALGSFSDRIERDDWTGSATRLHSEKYGATPEG
jgi:predicted flap endonuclease-1-like 5' DNA nuclease